MKTIFTSIDATELLIKSNKVNEALTFLGVNKRMFNKLDGLEQFDYLVNMFQTLDGDTKEAMFEELNITTKF